MKFEKMAEIAYSNDNEKIRKKAIAAGKAIDNSLELEYSKGGTTKCHFMLSNYIKYFSYEALGLERVELIMNFNLN